MSDEGGWRWLRRVFRPDSRTEAEEEIGFHLEMRRRDYAARGMDEEKARTAAEAQFGDVAGVRQELERMGESDRRVRRWRRWTGEFRQDVRQGARVMRRSPFAFLIVVLTLALGIGATTAMFSVVHGVLLRPLPYAAADALVRVWEVTPRGEDHNVVSAGNYEDWRTRARSFRALGAHRLPYGVALTGDGEPEQVLVSDLTPSVLEALGTSAQVGRVFTAEDAHTDARVVLLSHGAWQRRFGGSPGALGRALTLNEIPHTIVGVMPAEFDFAPAAELFRPVRATEIDPNERRSHNWLVIGRLAEGVTVAAAQAEMRELAAAIARDHPEHMTGWSVNVTPLHGDMVSEVRPLLLVLLGGVVLVLLVACGNVANLLLARALTRTQEMSVRAALGAGRSRLLRQVLAESLLLALAGGVAGVILARVFLDVFVSLAPGDIPRLDAVALDGTTLLFAAGAALVSTLLAGMLPALRLARSDLQSTLRASDVRAGGVAHGRLRSTLLVGEVTLSLILLAGAGLLVRSSMQLSRIDYGYDTSELAAVMLDLPRARYATTEAHREFYARLIEQVRTVPGVLDVSGTSEPPAVGYEMTFSFAIEGRPSTNASGREDPQSLHVVANDYFRTMRIPLVSGRAFDERDRSDAPAVIIINQALARRHWPGEDPVGRRISFAGSSGPWLEIVGVAGDTRMRAADQPPVPAMYLPHAQKTWTWMSWLSLMIRPQPGVRPESLRDGVAGSLARLDSELPIQRFVPVDTLYGESLARRRFAMLMMVAFAGAATLLGIIGMYGVLAYMVAQRRRDIGIRIALGASSASVVGGVVRHALVLAGIGIVLGGAGALALTRLLRGLLYEVSPTDPWTLFGVALLVAFIAALAAWIPARRAARVSAVSVMRES
jgi:predicted permease